MSVIRKITIFILAALSACMFACGGCSEDPTDPTNPSDNPTEQVNLLNGFETMQDLYNVMWMDIGYSTVGKMDINTDGDYIKDGEGSLVLSVTNHNWPELYFAKEQTNNPQMTVSDIKSVSVWIYNATDDAKVATLNVCAANLSHLLSAEVELPAKEWKECVLNVNAVVTKYAGESVIGFSIQFKTKGEQKFYIDSLSAEYGATLSAEDQQIISEIEGVTEAINNLPVNVSMDNESAFSSVYDRYNALPDIYKSAVSNYDKLNTAMKDLVAVRNKAEEAKDTAAINRPAFYFDSFYGMSLLSTSYDTRVNFSYSKDIKFGEEAGSTVIEFTGDVWNYINFSNTVPLKDYDYIEFALYNDGQEKAVWLYNEGASWSNRKQIKTNEWVAFSVPVTDLKDSGAQFIITTSVDSGEAAMTDGNIYISQIKAIKLGANEMYLSALDADAPISATNADVSYANGITTITANDNGAVTLALSKKEKTISVAQQVAFAFKSPSSQTLTLTGASGSVSVTEGYSTVVLTAAQYNSLTAISINVQKGDVFEISKFYISRISDAQGIKLIIEKDFLPELSAWTNDDLPQVIEYMKIYNDKDLTDLKKQFIKINETTDATLYAKQEAEYNAIIETLNSRASKIKTLTEALIDSISENSEDVDEIYLLDSVYSAYKTAVRLEAIDTAKAEKATRIIAKLEYLPYRLIDVSSSADRSKFSLITEFYSWTGSVAAEEDSDYGTVMGVTPTSFGVDNSNVQLGYDGNVVPSGYDYIRIRVFSPNKSRMLYFITYGWGETVTKFSLAADVWTDVYISVSAYKTAESMIISEMVVGETVKFCDILAYNEKYVIKSINELPEPADVTVANAQAIKSARTIYDLLSASFKKKVTNVDKLERCEAKLASLSIATLDVNAEITAEGYLKVKSVRAEYDALSENAKTYVNDADKNKLLTIEKQYTDKFAVIFDMSDISGFSVFHDSYGNGDVVSLSNGTDITYGNYLSAKISTKTHDHMVIKYLTDGLSATLDSCDKVYFYVYNGNSANMTLLYNFGGTLNADAATLKTGEWTLIEISATDFAKGSYFGILDAGSNAEYKFGAFYATKIDAEELVKNVADKIAALPTVDELEGVDGVKLAAARASYDALPESAKAKVSNYATLTELETAYNNKFVTIFDMTDVSGFSFNWGDNGLTLSQDYDSAYGNCLKVTHVTDGYEQVTINYPKEGLAEKLSGCDKVYFYVYNGYGSDRTILTDIGGYSEAYNNISLKSKDWTLVEMPVADFLSDSSRYFGILNVYGDVEFKFSMFWATKTAE